MYVRNTVSYFLEVDLTSSLRPCLLDGGKYRLSQSWGFTWTLAKMLIFFFFCNTKVLGQGREGVPITGHPSTQVTTQGPSAF